MGKQALKFLLRPLSAFSLVVPMFGMLGRRGCRSVLGATFAVERVHSEEG
jgi:hypothetical protein